MPEPCNRIKKETLAQVFSCEISEIFKSIFFYRTPPVAASVRSYLGNILIKTLHNTVIV